jgi:hypothetical protein
VLTIVEYSIFGFLLGSTLSGAGLYYYVVDEYRVSNELLSEDVYVSFEEPSISAHWICSLHGDNTGASIRRPEAGGLRQGSGAGCQVEEIGGSTNRQQRRR